MISGRDDERKVSPRVLFEGIPLPLAGHLQEEDIKGIAICLYFSA
jgi:hypothetical protein